MKIQNEKDAHSSVPPDKPITTRDVTSLPVSGSHLGPGKRSLPVPNKVGWPGLGQWGLACERREQGAALRMWGVSGPESRVRSLKTGPRRGRMVRCRARRPGTREGLAHGRAWAPLLRSCGALEGQPPSPSPHRGATAEMALLPSWGWCAEETGCRCFENYSSSQVWRPPSLTLPFVSQR